MAAGYTVESAGGIALAAATPKTVLSVINSASGLVRLCEISVSFGGVSGTAEPVTVELCSGTQATAGTSTAAVPVQTRGALRTAQSTGARNYTAEPTVLTVRRRWLVHPQASLVLQFPLGREPEQMLASGALALRCTAPAAVNVQAYMEFEEG